MGPLSIDVATTYVNDQQEVLVNAGDAFIFKAPTCGIYDSGYTVSVRVYNPHNPLNNPDLGITYFAATNKAPNGVSNHFLLFNAFHKYLQNKTFIQILNPSLP